jgi:hypothetical protein
MALSDVHSHNMKELSKELAPTIATTTENSENNQLSSMMEFVPPAEGTPAAAALQGSYFIKTMNLICFFLANAEVKISRLAKGMRKIGGIKHPKLKNVTRGFKLKKKKQVKFSRNFKGKVIDGVHELYTLTAGMMLGMRCAVSDISLSLFLSYLPCPPSPLYRLVAPVRRLFLRSPWVTSIMLRRSASLLRATVTIPSAPHLTILLILSNLKHTHH